jgi:hypothetical protein
VERAVDQDGKHREKRGRNVWVCSREGGCWRVESSGWERWQKGDVFVCGVAGAWRGWKERVRAEDGGWAGSDKIRQASCEEVYRMESEKWQSIVVY